MKDLPEELGEWVDTLGQQNVRKLSVVLIIDLLKLERDQVRAAEIADDMTALAEDLLMSGDYTDARNVAAALNEAAANPKSVARAACREALTSFGHSPAMHETVAMLSDTSPSCICQTAASAFACACSTARRTPPKTSISQLASKPTL